MNGVPSNKGQIEWKPWSPENEQAGESLLVINANKIKSIIYMSNKPYQYDDVVALIEQDNTVTPEEKQQIITQVLNGRWFSEPLDKQFSHKETQ